MSLSIEGDRAAGVAASLVELHLEHDVLVAQRVAVEREARELVMLAGTVVEIEPVVRVEARVERDFSLSSLTGSWAICRCARVRGS